MLDSYFEFDGVNSLDAGIRQQSEFVFSGHVPIVETEQVPGRNGDLHFYDGSFENVEGTVNCFVLAERADVALSAVKKWVLGSTGYKRLEISTDPSCYRMARISTGAETEIRLQKLAPFELTFDCMPQRFLKSGEYSIEMQEAGTLYNEGMQALPLITVYGSGSGLLQIGDYVISFSEIDEYTALDCNLQDAYKGTVSKNSTIYAPTFPKFDPGEINVSWSGGITRLEIIPRWWTL